MLPTTQKQFASRRTNNGKQGLALAWIWVDTKNEGARIGSALSIRYLERI
jgi:hypothetical protein